MEPSKRCARCNKPIWDADYVSLYDAFMERDEDIHSACYKAQTIHFHENEIEAGLKALAKITRSLDLKQKQEEIDQL